MEPIGFDALMLAGQARLNEGLPLAALRWFREAAEQTGSRRSEALQLCGVCLRILRHYNQAEEAFEQALKEAPTNGLQRAKVLRDWSSLSLAQGNYTQAIDQLNRALRHMRRYNRRSEQHRFEYWITYIYLGEAYWLAGDRAHARDILCRSAYRRLKGHNPYELNALMRILPTLRPWARAVVAKRALFLAQQANNQRRIRQIRLLIAAPWLATMRFR